MSTMTKLAQNPLPVDRLARRVVKAALPENIWRPMPKFVEKKVFSPNVLEVMPIPATTSPVDMSRVIGMRRGSLVILGYAKEQGAKKQGAKWVVRCDCGNYEHRTKIIRWIGTNAEDSCVECQKREYQKKGWQQPKTPAKRVKFELPAKVAQ